MFTVRGFKDVEVGHAFSHSVTVTETHLVLGAGLFGDFHPLHTNEEYARRSRFGHRITHGPLTAGIMAGVLGNYFAGSAGPYLEQTVRFRSPVAPTVPSCTPVAPISICLVGLKLARPP